MTEGRARETENSAYLACVYVLLLLTSHSQRNFIVTIKRRQAPLQA